MSAREPAVGTAAQEAARLLQSLGRWFAPPPAADDHRAAGDQHDARCTNSRTDDPTDGCTDDRAEAHDGATCRVCPVCRGIEAVRSVRPELVEHLALAAGSLAAALRELSRPPSGRAGGAPREPAADRGPGGPTSGPVGVPVRISGRDDDLPPAEPAARAHGAASEDQHEQEGAASWG